MSYPTFSFGCICGPKFQNLCLYVTGSLQIGTHLNIQLFSNRSARGFQIFHRKLSVVWAKRSLVANNIESKSYYSPLILHSVRVLQKYAFEYTKTKVSLRFFWVPTKHCPYIKKYKMYTLYTESNVSYILFDICGCFDVPGFELLRFYSIASTSKK